MTPKSQSPTNNYSYRKRIIIILLILAIWILWLLSLQKARDISLESRVLTSPSTYSPYRETTTNSETTTDNPTTREPNTTEIPSTTNCPDIPLVLWWDKNPEYDIGGYYLYVSGGTTGDRTFNVTGGKIEQSVILAASPEGIVYTFRVSAFNTRWQEGPRSNYITYTAVCGDKWGGGSIPGSSGDEEEEEYPTPPVYPTADPLTSAPNCNYQSKTCYIQAGSDENECSMDENDSEGKNASCICPEGEVEVTSYRFHIEVSYDMKVWTRAIGDVGYNFDLNEFVRYEAISQNFGPNAFFRLGAVGTLRCVPEWMEEYYPPLPPNFNTWIWSSVLGASLWVTENSIPSPSLWSRFVSFLSWLFSSNSSLKSDSIDTSTPPSQPKNFNLTDIPSHNVQIATPSISQGDKIIMGGDLWEGIHLDVSKPILFSIPEGTKITLKALLWPNSTSVKWSGGCKTITSDTCTFVVTRAKWVTATFTPILKYTLTTNKTGSGTGSIGGISGSSQWFPDWWVSLVLTATPADGSSFGGWSGACTGTKICIVTMDSNKRVAASFVKAKATSTLTVSRWGTGSGTFWAYNTTYTTGSKVIIIATPTAGSTFTGWTGCTSVSGTACTIQMNTDKTITATFTTIRQPAQYSLTVKTAGTGSGRTSAIARSYKSWTTTSVTALANTKAIGGSTFTKWDGCTYVSGTVCTISMTSDKTITATFTLTP